MRNLEQSLGRPPIDQTEEIGSQVVGFYFCSTIPERSFVLFCFGLAEKSVFSAHSVTPLFFPSWTLPIISTAAGESFFPKFLRAEAHAATSRLTPTDNACLLLIVSRTEEPRTTRTIRRSCHQVMSLDLRDYCRTRSCQDRRVNDRGPDCRVRREILHGAVAAKCLDY